MYWGKTKQWGIAESPKNEKSLQISFPLVVPNTLLTILIAHSDKTEADASSVAAIGYRDNTGFWVVKAHPENTHEVYWVALGS